MHQEILIDAYKKVKSNSLEISGIPPSDTEIFKKLSIILLDDYQTNYGYKSLSNVYKGVISIKQEKVLDALCKFLDYLNYEDYIRSLPTQVEEAKSKSFKEWLEKYRVSVIIISISITIIIISFSFFMTEKQRWMVWNGDHYVEVDFNIEKYNLGELKLYKEERIKYFKKIEATCEIEYLDKSGKPQIWYGKNSKKELEIFTSFGLHPETGQTLKPISKYMIKKYFCNDYKK